MTALICNICNTQQYHFDTRFCFDFVTCRCSSRTKRHDNLFLYDDDDDYGQQLTVKGTEVNTC